MGRTPGFAVLRRIIRLATLCEDKNISTVEGLERIAEAQWSRRRFLSVTARTVAGGILSPLLWQQPALGATAPRVVIIGAGCAGLTCAYRLQQRGLHAQVLEAGKRVGGRMFSLRDTFPEGQIGRAHV